MFYYGFGLSKWSPKDSQKLYRAVWATFGFIAGNHGSRKKTFSLHTLCKLDELGRAMAERRLHQTQQPAQLTSWRCRLMLSHLRRQPTQKLYTSGASALAGNQIQVSSHAWSQGGLPLRELGVESFRPQNASSNNSARVSTLHSSFEFCGLP